MISIQKIKLKELEEFICSAVFENLKNKPISKARAISYLKNSRANSDDVVVYLAFIKNEFVGYRTILCDSFFTGNKQVSFGWLSGNWVHDQYRRKGISTLLFNEVFKDWEGKLMFTNYAEASKLLYDKTQQFSVLQKLKGTKYYMRFCFADILPKKKKVFEKTKFVWVILDVFLNFFLNVRNLFIKEVKVDSFYVKVNEKWNASILEFINNFTIKNLFKRSQEEFNWIQKNPWILTDNKTKTTSKSYHFSSYAKQFESNFYTIYNSENCLIGCVLLTIRDGHIKVPYLYYLQKDSKRVATFIIDKCKEMKAKTIVIYDKDIEEELNKQLLFVAKKAFLQKYFIIKALEKSLENKEVLEIQSGDGDVVFT